MDKVEERIEAIKELIVKRANPKRVILFGSRAKGTANQHSDIDLAVELGKELSHREKRKLREEVDRLAGIYSVDIVFMDELDEVFRDRILETGRVLYEQN